MGERAVAKLIDWLILAIPAALLVLPFVVVEGEEASIEQPVWATAALVALFVVYDTVLVALWGTTVGKRAFSLRVARLGDGGPPDWSHAAIRVLLPAAIAVVPVIGILALSVFARAVVDPLRRGFHDLAAGTVVVRSA